ncbi:hypothetical protein ACIBK8_13225 [Streptomyces sp. NPDC050161]|uniref:hypothetical protein n=1 Tax=Streptomyces sp. NPDC050161 TaxID=3365604 RepID=UPI0037BD0562
MKALHGYRDPVLQLPSRAQDTVAYTMSAWGPHNSLPLRLERSDEPAAPGPCRQLRYG